MANGAITIREWARANGFDVAQRGRLAPAVHQAYRAANPQAEPPTGTATCNCGRRWTAARQCHCTVCHRQFATVRWFDEHWRNVPERKRGQTVRQCHDPLQLTYTKGEHAGELKFKLVADAWGEVVTLAIERPESFDDDDEGVLL